jgi:hypothetical protein
LRENFSEELNSPKANLVLSFCSSVGCYPAMVVGVRTADPTRAGFPARGNLCSHHSEMLHVVHPEPQAPAPAPRRTSARHPSRVWRCLEEAGPSSPFHACINVWQGQPQSSKRVCLPQTNEYYSRHRRARRSSGIGKQQPQAWGTVSTIRRILEKGSTEARGQQAYHRNVFQPFKADPPDHPPAWLA